MHVGIICNEHPLISEGGGIGSFTDSLSKGLIKNGHSVIIFGVYKSINKKIVINKEKLKIVGIPYVYIPKIHNWYNRRRLMAFIENENSKKKISILESPDYQGWLYKTNLSIPKIIRFHSSQKVGFDSSIDIKNLPLDLKLEEKSLSYADYLCACGSSVADAARKTYISSMFPKNKKIKIIYNSVDTDVFKPSKKINRNSKNIVFAGRLSYKKGVVELIKAWEKFNHRYSDFKLILAGNDSKYNTLSMKEYLQSILSPKAKKNVIFRGFLSNQNMIKLFQESTIFIFPSHREAFSVVVLEAMSTGTPVIYSKIKPGYEIIKDGINGLLCDPKDPDDIMNSILKIIEDEDLKTSLGINGRKTVENNFSIEKIVIENIKFYESCIKNYV